ncbi:MAG: DUF2336 domain-containing protein [Alphaproteobacteria bacterium]|nr:DUF2336 domain-containing protein [Alphaproteobacteria bacterium]
MALDKSSSGRNALARSVADICLEESTALSGREIELVFDILHTLIHTVEMRVRRDLAQRLAPRRDVPRDLIVTLANDQIDVAYPVLVESEVLEDADLIDITRAQRATHQIAITLRERVSPIVSEALVETNNLDVIDSLMRNPSAELAPPTMQRLVELSRETPPLRRPLLQRHDLSPELAWQMSSWVGEALKEYITENYPAEYDRIELEIDEAVRDIAAGDTAQPDLATQLAEIERAGGITAATLIQTLRDENIELFEALFARLTGIDTVAMPVIVYDPGGEPFAIACKACGVEAGEFEQLYLLLAKTLAGEHADESEELKRILAYYRNLDDMAARSVVAEWRRAPSKAWQTA